MHDSNKLYQCQYLQNIILKNCMQALKTDLNSDHGEIKILRALINAVKKEIVPVTFETSSFLFLSNQK